VNVWLALTHEIHLHHASARAWCEALESDAIVCFCRFTQLGLLRLLTNASAMGVDVLTQRQAWDVYDALVANPCNCLADEPEGIDALFRRQTNSEASSTKQWADGYLAAFAESSGMRLVTFDRALAAKTKDAVLLAGA
jgi:hypothetical protein